MAKGLLELPASIKKGLSQRFLWLFPKTSFSMLESLETIEKFCCYVGECKLMSNGVVVGMYMYCHHTCG